MEAMEGPRSEAVGQPPHGLRRGGLLQGILPFQRSSLVRDGLAGLNLAALAIPEVMGYTRISQTPVVTGLYTLLLPAVAFALVGSSRLLVVAADSATAAILAATLTDVAAPTSPQYVALTSLVAVLVAAMLLVAAILRLGFLADFLSRSALIGLLTGIGVQVAAGEAGGLLGLPKQGQGAVEQVLSVFGRFGEVNGLALLVSLLVLAVIIACKRWFPRLPGPLIAVVGATLASWALDLQHHGIAVVGAVPPGLPMPALPDIRPTELNQALITAASCFVVIVAQSAATARAYAQRHGERSNENGDLLGLAFANFGAGITGTFVVNGSPTKTEMVEEAGGRSQIAQLAAAGVVLLVLLFFTGPLSLLPGVALSAIVFLIGIRLIDLQGMRDLYRLQRNEFVIASLTVITVALVGVMQGIVLAVVLSLIDQVRHTYRPRTRLWIPEPAGRGFHTVPVAPGIFAAPGIVAYRFEANLFYANADRFLEEILDLITLNASPIRALVIDATGIDDVDYSAARTLLQLRQELHQRGILLTFVVSSGHLLKVFARFGIGMDAPVHHSVKKAIRSLAQQLSG